MHKKNTVMTLPATQKVEQAIRIMVQNGKLAPRMRLPTEMMLCRHVGVSRTTVRSALRALRETGEIEPVAQGRGWRIADGAAMTRKSDPAWTDRMVGVVSGCQLPRNNPHEIGSGRSVATLFGMLQALTENSFTAAVQDIAQWESDAVDAGRARHAWLATNDAVANPAVFRRLAALREQGTPVAVQYDRDADLPFDRVVSDHAGGAKMLAEWLFGRGCRKILAYFPTLPPACSRAAEDGWLDLRRKGYEAAHRAAGRTPMPYLPAHVIPSLPPSREAFFMAVDLAHAFLMRALAVEPAVDAVMCNTDGTVMAVKEALQRFPDARLRRIPVTGYDNYWNDCPEFAWTGHRPDATVDKGNAQLGRETVSVLARRRADPERDGPIIRYVEPILHVISS